ncbi:MAG: hypothetical protein F4X26_01460 [Chloroflexi bacterium]|nr:hypothetical protein [Chloroflexota bacterium]
MRAVRVRDASAADEDAVGVDRERRDVREEQLVADGLRVVGGPQPGGEAGERLDGARLPRGPELLGGGHPGRLGDEGECLAAAIDGAVDDHDRLGVEDGLQARDKLAVPDVDGGVERFAELQDAGREVVPGVDGFLDGRVVIAPAAGGGEQREQRDEDGRGARESNVHGASRVVEHYDRSTVACG